jgi:hypothetical protein
MNKKNCQNNIVVNIARPGTTGKAMRPVQGTNIRTGEVVTFASTADAGRNGFFQAGVSAAANGVLGSHCSHGGTSIYKGFKWRFV